MIRGRQFLGDLAPVKFYLGYFDGVAFELGQRVIQSTGVGYACRLGDSQVTLKLTDFVVSGNKHFKLGLDFGAEAVEVVFFVVDFDSGHICSLREKPHPLVKGGV